MGFGADLTEALGECADLINTGRVVAGGAGRGESLETLRDVVAFARRHRVENPAAARAGDLARVREFRGRLDAICRSCAAGDQPTAIAGLNALLAEAGAVPRIVSHDGRGPHLHVSRATAPLADRIAAHCAMALAELVVAGQGDRIRTCAAPGCEAVFIDLSRNRSRRYCDSRTCGNRQHVAAYRARRAGRGAIMG